MSNFSIFSLGLILLTASLVAIVSRRLHLPYSVGLVVAGIALALVPHTIKLPLSRDLIYNVFLPPLIFEAALHLNWQPFRRNLPVTVGLAFPGVLVSAAFVATCMHFVASWSWNGAMLFGALISATDPVSVIAAFREMNVGRRLSILVESESLMNDGAASVGFTLLVAIAGGGSATALGVIGSLVWTVAGGVGIGLGVTGILLLVAGRTDDRLIEITLTTIAAYGSFLLAEHFSASGVLASLTSGLLVGNFGMMRSIKESNREHVLAFWEYAAFLVNSIIFILIGGHEAHQHLVHVAAAAAAGIGLVLIGRAISVYTICGLFAHSALRVERGKQHVMVWGGLRGAMALALALALPPGIQERGAIVTVAFTVVAFSIFVQGLTMPWLIRRLGLMAADTKSEAAQAQEA